jgi:FtsZ-binding cell division protein ZapB
MEICKQLTCNCSGIVKLYSTPGSLREHKKTKMHRLWEEEREKKDLQKDSTKLQNDKDRLNRLVESLREDVESYRKRFEKAIDKIDILQTQLENLKEENDFLKFNNTETLTVVSENEKLRREFEKLKKLYICQEFDLN